MRYRLMATYRGVPYEAGIGPTDQDVVLFAACPPPEELGFEPATGHWRKQLRVRDVQALWESRPMGTFRGDRCIVLDDLGDRLHIAYLGHDAYQAERLGYWEVDRGVFELITPRDEVSEIVEERADYPHRPAGAAPDSGPIPAAAQYAAAPTSGYGSAPALRGPEPPPAGLATTGPHPVPHLTGPHAAPNLTGPHAARPNLTGPHAVPNLTGPHAAPNLTSPHAAPNPAAPAATRPGSTGPHAAVPGASGAHDAGPQAPASGTAGPDLAVIPPTREPALPLEAAARRAAAARVLQPSSPPPAPEAGPATGPRRAPGPRSGSGPRPEPAPSRDSRSSRRRRSATRRAATQRIFSELAGLAAIPPSAYAVGEEVDGAMCLIQTPDGFEVFNAAAGARHEVRIFDDEESAYFYLFGVLAAEAVRTGRLAPQG